MSTLEIVFKKSDTKICCSRADLDTARKRLVLGISPT